jgi:xanthine dehydrogenase YagT iron-sulfur-binding subunit
VTEATDDRGPTDDGIDRRTFLGAAVAAGIPILLNGPTGAIPQAVDAADTRAGVTRAPSPAPVAVGPHPVPVQLTINGRTRHLMLEPRVSLLDALREYAGLTGTKKGCDHGQCGACTVHVNGERVLSCLTLALQVRGKEVTTIEGLARADGTLHPMQRAFIEHDGFQCGYCTPGQIMSAVALLHEPCGSGGDDVRENMSGNICRCGAYQRIRAAIKDAAGGGATPSPTAAEVTE